MYYESKNNYQNLQLRAIRNNYLWVNANKHFAKQIHRFKLCGCYFCIFAFFMEQL